MQLRYRSNDKEYIVATEDGQDAGFRIWASPLDPDEDDFVMHYNSIAEFCDDWEDIE